LFEGSADNRTKDLGGSKMSKKTTGKKDQKEMLKAGLLKEIVGSLSIRQKEYKRAHCNWLREAEENVAYAVEYSDKLIKAEITWKLLEPIQDAIGDEKVMVEEISEMFETVETALLRNEINANSTCPLHNAIQDIKRSAYSRLLYTVSSLRHFVDKYGSDTA